MNRTDELPLQALLALGRELGKLEVIPSEGWYIIPAVDGTNYIVIQQQHEEKNGPTV